MTVAATVSKTETAQGLDLSDDRALVRACLARNQPAFKVLVERHRRAIYQLCYRFVGNHEDASDLSQDVFLRAHRGLRKFRGESSLSTWLYRIGVNVCVDRVNAKVPVTEPIEVDRHVDPRSDDPAAHVLQAERASRVRAAITRLPHKQRATLILRMYHELSHQEIAAILGNSVGSVKANVFHALGNLKEMLEAERARGWGRRGGLRLGIRNLEFGIRTHAPYSPHPPMRR